MKNFSVFTFMLFGFTASAFGALNPDQVRQADQKKTQSYLRDGLYIGGDRAVSDVTVKDIRRAANAGYERLVIDLDGTVQGEPRALPRPPYYQVAVSPEEKRLVFTLWGSPRLAFEPRRVVQGFKKSAVVSSLDLYPRLEKDQWTFVVNLKSGKPVEVFELTEPSRIIVDIRSSGADAEEAGDEDLKPKVAPRARKKR